MKPEQLAKLPAVLFEIGKLVGSDLDPGILLSRIAELICQLGVTMPDGQEGVQPSRILGINGPRWLLRATFLGRPAVEPEVGDAWEQVLHHIVVSRGKTPMPKGEALPIVIPPDVQQVTEA